MNLRSIFNSAASIQLAIFLGRIIPARPGFWLADRVGIHLASRKESHMVIALRANLKVVLQGNPDESRLDELVTSSLRGHVRRLFEFYHYLDRPAEIDRRVRFSQDMQQIVDDWKAKPFGVLVMGVHVSAFDLGLISLALHGLKILALSVPNPNGQYNSQNEIRMDHGLEMAPISTSALQLARQRLQQGGMVVTGADRPAENATYTPLFFGQPSHLPVFYTRLALHAGVPVIVVGIHDDANGIHTIDCSEKIWMEPQSDPREEIIYNTERVLSVVEKFISAQPEKWAMFFPVWPDINEDSSIAKS
jgi:lauroyl/myristoyl acyltransferase